MTDDEFGEEIEEEFKEEIGYAKEEEAATDEELLLRMKKRIIQSYRWREDIIAPFSEELKISPEELEEILMKRLDMSSLEALQPRFESSKPRCTKERIHSDLKLCWLCDVMNILTEDEAEEIKNKIAIKILKEDEPYEDALEEGRRELLEHLKR
jgi:energy-converting hydrogenase A subunit M